MIERNQGISLLELMLTIFIFSMISMFSMPIYKNYLSKANKIEAESALFDLANRLENYYAIYNTYTNATIGTGKNTDVLTTTLSANKKFTLSIILANNNFYKIQAHLNNAHKDDEHINFILCSDGIQDSL